MFLGPDLRLWNIQRGVSFSFRLILDIQSEYTRSRQTFELLPTLIETSINIVFIEVGVCFNEPSSNVIFLRLLMNVSLIVNQRLAFSKTLLNDYSFYDETLGTRDRKF